MKKHKKPGRFAKLACLLGALVVLVGGYAAVKHFTQAQSVVETEISFEIAGVSPEEVNALSWTYDGETLRLTRQDGVWSLEGEETFPLNQALADEMAESITGLTATHSITGVEDPADYGLETPAATVEVGLEDGETLVYEMGDYNELTDEYYLRFSKNEALYTVATSLESIFPYGRVDLLDKPEIPSFDNPNHIVIAGTDADVDQTYFEDSTGMTYTDAYHWFHVGMDGKVLPSDTEKVETLLSTISGITWQDCADTNASEEALAGYGLSPAQTTVSVDWTQEQAEADGTDAAAEDTAEETEDTSEEPEAGTAEETEATAAEEAQVEYMTFELLIGAMDEETGMYYAALPGSAQVYLIDADTAETLQSATNDSLRTDDVLNLDTASITGLEFSYDGVTTHTLVYTKVEAEAAEDADAAEPEAEAALPEETETDDGEAEAEAALPEETETDDGEAEAEAALPEEAETDDGEAETGDEEAQEEYVWQLDGVTVDTESVESVLSALTALQSTGTAQEAADEEAVLRVALLRESDSFDRVEIAFYAYDAENYLYELLGERRLLVDAGEVDAIARSLKYIASP